ncbi:MAG: acetyl-CoA carboxylase biotin carboxylase subunit [Bacteroidetes bacterium SW_9_63_38]|nr:MAG: acetyl-CoA carboxylase biotin carboxylase subunit [Bacteroidetes bacterium SW_9_63_38]
MSDLQKILIANRGEIALRIIRTCHEMKINTVAVYSTMDREALHVRFADEAVCIGPPTSKESYLRPDRIIAAAEVTGADAIHPGYGFLSESAEFSQICADNDVEFIGPDPETMRLMSQKSVAKETMAEAGVPIVEGSDGTVNDIDEARSVATDIGFPVMVKAASGGGGKGMRLVWEEEEFDSAFKNARNEADAAFDDPEVYIEKFVEKPRHVEIQLLGDGQGNVMHFGERECSIQRRHQKLVEECPSPIVDEELRQEMGEAAVRGAEAVNYEGAGTIEFLVGADRNFYFMEMNTRIQVEHPITEEVTDCDLVEYQIQVSQGETIERTAAEMEGHAIECRINAENPYFNFSPAPGEITAFHQPGGHGVRIDTAAYSSYVIPPTYDSMIAKLITYGKTRDQAIRKMRRALDEFIVEGVDTTIPFHQQLFYDDRFVEGNFDTRFLDDFQMEERPAEE